MHARLCFVSLTLAAMLTGCSAPPPTAPTPSGTPVSSKTTVNNSETIIQVALLLDTSSSMNGLLEQAKSQLWKIVNELGKSNQSGKTPLVQVAVYEYGKASLDARKGFIRKVNDFTTELDSVSEGLFQLNCNGGNEYCGYAIDTAVTDLQWSGGDKVYKVIFIAGNEPFTQGPVDYHQACAKAREKGIFVNTIHCGSPEQGEREGWKDGAAAGDGRYLAINQNQQVAQVAAPQDKELAQLSSLLNQSYIPYGNDGKLAVARQNKMDESNASLGSAVYSERVSAKASKSYSNENWDLVDAVQKGKVDLQSVQKEALPPAMQTLKPEERAAFVSAKQKERSQVQAKIQQLSTERSAFLAKQTKTTGGIDEAVLSAVKSQAATKGYEFK